MFGLLIALAGWNPFNPPWNVNFPFPFPSDQGGHDKTNCRPVILSTQGPVSQKTALTYGWVFFRQNTTATGLLARDWEYFPIRLQPFAGRLPDSPKGAELTAIFSGRLPDSLKGVELTAGSCALWSGLLPNNAHSCSTFSGSCNQDILSAKMLTFPEMEVANNLLFGFAETQNILWRTDWSEHVFTCLCWWYF